MTWAHKARGSEGGEPDETGFPREGYALGDLAGAVFQREWPDVVVLDVMMPKVDGFEVCRRIREVDENVPVLFLSARDGIIDKRIGFSFGGDDYLVKPFNEEELVMRIEALVRRSRRSRRDGEAAAPERPERFALGPFTFDEVRHEVLKGGEPVVLTPKEFQLLHHLASHPGAVMGKDELIEELWGEEYLDGHLHRRLRAENSREDRREPRQARLPEDRLGRGILLRGVRAPRNTFAIKRQSALYGIAGALFHRVGRAIVHHYVCQ